MDYFDVLEKCLDKFQGTLEEFGALLYDATKQPWGINSESYRRDVEVIRRAKNQILSLGQCGHQLIQLEKKS